MENTNSFGDIKKIIAPAGVKVGPNHLIVGNKLVKTLFIFSYPRFLATGWFEPLVNLPNLFDISIFINPVDTGTALKNLRRKSAQIESQITDQEDKGLVRDPLLETALKDVESLRDSLQQAQEKLFSVGVYMAIYADTEDELAKLESRITSLMDTQLVYIKPALFEQLEGLFSVMPLGKDKLSVTTPMNSGPVSSFFPFISEDLTSDQGIMYGVNLHNNGLVIFDRFSLENANQVVFAKSGSGKSIVGSEPVLVKKDGHIQLMEIGKVVEEQIATHGATQIDDELEGVVDPHLEVWSFDRALKGSWSKVSVAARKTAPEDFYTFTTKSGRAVTTTGDHNMLVLRNGQVVTAKSAEVREGEYIPLPRHIEPSGAEPQFLNLLDILKDSPRIYVAHGDAIIHAHYAKLKQAVIDPALDAYLYKYCTGSAIPIGYFIKILSVLGIGSNDAQVEHCRITSKSNRSSLPIRFPANAPFLAVLGYIAAEGTITKDAVMISNLDEVVLEDISSACRAMGVSSYAANRGMVIAERPFVELVRALGAGGKSAEKRVAPRVFGMRTEEIAAYLRTYFEGDGGVETGGVVATSKSRGLLSDIAYLLYYFDIVGRIAKTEKWAPQWTEKKTYWRLTISGQENLERFSSRIGFVSARKQALLRQRLGRKGNTNVDIIPSLGSIVQELCELLPAQLHGIPGLSEVKRGMYRPSRGELRAIIKKIEERLAHFETLEKQFSPLANLLSLERIAEEGRGDKTLNRKLWQELGTSWRLMKNRVIEPGTANVLTAIRVIRGNSPTLYEVKGLIHKGFTEMDISIKHHSRALASALMNRPESTSYPLLYGAAQRVLGEHRGGSTRIPRIRTLLKQLKLLALSDLFWDPIVKIEKMKNINEKYVYDLTVNNEVFLAGNAGMFVHNSYATKLEIIRSLMMGVDVLVIDPENEYSRLAEAFGGSFFNISISSEQHINPFEIPVIPEGESPTEVLRSHIVNIAGLVKLMLGKISAEEDALLDRAVTETYASREITPDTDFSNAQPPLLEDLETVLRNLEGGRAMAERLYKFTKGSFAGFLNRPTNVDIANRLIVFSIRDLEDELRPIAMYVILNFIWNLIRARLKKRVMIIDEAWWMMKDEASAAFLFGLAKRARKYYLGVSTITQDVEDFLRSPYGRPIITNSSLQLLLKQAPATIDIVAKAFDLTDEEKKILLAAEVGTGLFFAGRQHVKIQIVPSYFENQLITTNPQELLEGKNT